MPQLSRTEAVHAVGADDVASRHMRSRAPSISTSARTASPSLTKADQRRAARDFDAEGSEPVEQDRLGPVLRQHQEIPVLGGEAVKPDQTQKPITVPEGEFRDLSALGQHGARDADSVEDLQCMRVDDCRARGGLRRFRLLDQERADPALRECNSDCEPDRAGADDENVTGIGQHLVNPFRGLAAVGHRLRAAEFDGKCTRVINGR